MISDFFGYARSFFVSSPIAENAPDFTIGSGFLLFTDCRTKSRRNNHGGAVFHTLFHFSGQKVEAYAAQMGSRFFKRALGTVKIFFTDGLGLQGCGHLFNRDGICVSAFLVECYNNLDVLWRKLT